MDDSENAAWRSFDRQQEELLADFRTVFFGKIKIAERTMKIHSRTEHVRIDDENFLALRTGNFYRLTHDSLLTSI
jgi:hypothetical protein